MIVSKSTTFDAAHFLPGYGGKCSQMHGHRFKIQLGVRGEVDERTGMVIDFVTLNSFLLQIKANLDHHLLNDVISNPTAENICEYIYHKYYEQDWGFDAVENLHLAWIKVWETADSMAMLEGD